MTPLFQHVEKVKETCARLSLENAAVTATCTKMRADNAKLREEVNELTTRLQESETLRERDLFHLKQADDLLADKLGVHRSDLLLAVEKNGEASSKQIMDAATAAAEALEQLKAAMDARLDGEQAQLRSEQTERLMDELMKLEQRADRARQELRETVGSDVGALRDSLGTHRSESAAAFDAVRAEQSALGELSESNLAMLRQEIAGAVESATRALEAKIMQLQASLVRLDQKSKAQAAALDESREEALAKLDESQEARGELEGRVATLEFRVESLQRALQRAEERAHE